MFSVRIVPQLKEPMRIRVRRRTSPRLRRAIGLRMSQRKRLAEYGVAAGYLVLFGAGLVSVLLSVG